MNRCYLIFAAAISATPVTAQNGSVTRVEESRAGTAIHYSQATEVDQTIVRALQPYIFCLSEQTMTLQSDNIYLSDGPEVAEGIKEDCSEKRDLAIYDAAVALERSDHVPESKRSELIFETIEALEKASLVPPGLPEKYEESE